MARNLSIALALGLSLTLPTDSALAKGGFSSGSHGFSSGHSYSSGSHSFSSGSHGFSSGGTSSHSFSSGKSYSSGSHSFSSGSHSSSPGSSGFSSGGGSRSFSSGKSYSSGSGSSRASGGSGNRAPSTGGSLPKFSGSPGFDGRSNPSGPSVSPAGPQSPQTSGRSYSSGSRSATSFPSGKSYSSTAQPANFGTRPSHANYDASAAAMKQREASRAAFTAGQAPRPTYTDQVGRPQPVDPESPVVRQLRRDLNYERWTNRELRERQYYGNSWSGWYNSRPIYSYRDPFSDLFWYWMLSQSFQTQAQWAYNHHDMMDDARYRDLLARDSRIEQEIRNLEQQGVPRDPTRTPQATPGQPMPPDLMYNDNYVQAVYNPQPQRTSGGFGHALVRFVLIVAAILGLIWLVFFKRWGGEKSLGTW